MGERQGRLPCASQPLLKGSCRRHLLPSPWQTPSPTAPSSKTIGKRPRGEGAKDPAQGVVTTPSQAHQAAGDNRHSTCSLHPTRPTQAFPETSLPPKAEKTLAALQTPESLVPRIWRNLRWPEGLLMERGVSEEEAGTWALGNAPDR